MGQNGKFSFFKCVLVPQEDIFFWVESKDTQKEKVLQVGQTQIWKYSFEIQKEWNTDAWNLDSGKKMEN